MLATVHIGESDRVMIANALRVAAEIYRRDAKLMLEMHPADVGERLKAQFTAQAEDAEKWADAIESADEVVIR